MHIVGARHASPIGNLPDRLLDHFTWIHQFAEAFHLAGDDIAVFQEDLGVHAFADPGGVPVRMMSPASSVKDCEQ